MAESIRKALNSEGGEWAPREAKGLGGRGVADTSICLMILPRARPAS